MEVFNPILLEGCVYHVCKMVLSVETWTHQWLLRSTNESQKEKAKEVHTSEITSEISTNKYKHTKDLQYKEHPNDK